MFDRSLPRVCRSIVPSALRTSLSHVGQTVAFFKRRVRHRAAMSLPVAGVISLCLAALSAPSSAMEYRRTTFAGTYVDIRPATALVFGNLDNDVRFIPLPFSFTFDGTVWDTTSFLAVSTEGYAYFVASDWPMGADSDNQLLFNTSAEPHNVMAPWWDDLNTGPVGSNPAGQVVWKAMGSPGSRTLTVQWTNVTAFYSGGSIINFQLALEEGTNAIEFRYGTVSGPSWSPGSASIGLKGSGFLDAITGSDTIFNAMQECRSWWPSRSYRFEPGTTPPLAAGTYTVGGGGDYPSLTEAVADLNHRGIDGPVTFTLTDATYSSGNAFPILIGPVAGTSEASPVTLEPGGASALITSGYGGAGYAGTAANLQAISPSTMPVFAILGGDFITLRNLSLQSQGSQGLVDRVLVLMNASPTDGASDNLVEGVTVSHATSTYEVMGVVQEAKFVPASAAGTNSRNRYLNMYLHHLGSGGFDLIGNVATPDQEIEIGGTGGGRTIIGGVITNGAGIRARNQANIRIHDCDIHEINGFGHSPASGIWLDNSVTSTISSGLCEISNNRIYALGKGAEFSSSVKGLYVNLTANSSSQSHVFNNIVYDLHCYSNTTGQNIVGIAVQYGGGGTGATHNIDFNSVRLSPVNLVTTNVCFQGGTAIGPVVNVRNNVFANFTGAQSGTAKHVCVYTPSATSVGAPGSVWDHNVLYVATPTNGYTGLAGTSTKATLADWQGVAPGVDVNSLPWNPQFLSATDLHINPAMPTYIEGRGSFFAGAIDWVDGDFDGDARNGTTPDIGADEGNFIAPPDYLDASATAIIVPAPGDSIQERSSFSPQASFTNVGGVITTTTPVRFRIVGPSPDTTEVYTASSSIAPVFDPMAVATITFAPGSITVPGTYTMFARTLLPGDFDPGNDQIQSTLIIKPARHDGAATQIIAPTPGSRVPETSTITPSAKFTNLGSIAENDVLTRFRIVGPAPDTATIYSQTGTIAHLGIGAVGTVAFPSQVMTGLGTYTMYARCELAGDANPANDQVQGTFDVVPANHDMAATQILTPAPGSKQEPLITFAPRASFTNQGSVNEVNIPVRFRIIGPAPDTAEVYNQTVEIASLAPAAVGTLPFPAVSISVVGTYTMLARSLLPADTNRVNNEVQGTLLIAPFFHDVAAGQLVAPIPGSSIEAGSTIMPKASFTNAGEAVETNIPVAFRIVGPSPDTTEIYSQTGNIASLAAGQTITVVFAPSSIYDVGTYTMYARSVLSGDDGPDNDQVQGTFEVFPFYHDLSATVIITPAPGSSMERLAMFTPEATCTNVGSMPETNFPVRFRITGPAPDTTAVYSQTVSVASLAPAAEVTVTFPAASLATEGTYTMSFRTLLSTDEYRANNQVQDTVDVASVSGLPPAGNNARTFVWPVHPNPFAGRTTLHFSLKESLPVRLQILDAQGRLVRTLIKSTLGAGGHTVQWNGRSDRGAPVASGWYVLRFEAGTTVQTRTMQVVGR